MEHFMEYKMAMISVKIEDDMPCRGSSCAFLGSTVASQTAMDPLGWFLYA